jgi:hypothetical protein
MRHNPAAGAVVIMLRTVKMHGMAQAVGELTEQGSPAFEAAVPIVSQLLKAETADREVRSTAYQLKAAHLTETSKLDLRIPRDREGTFDPKLIARYQRRFPGFDEIVSMYARGMNLLIDVAAGEDERCDHNRDAEPHGRFRTHWSRPVGRSFGR